MSETVCCSLTNHMISVEMIVSASNIKMQKRKEKWHRIMWRFRFKTLKFQVTKELRHKKIRNFLVYWLIIFHFTSCISVDRYKTYRKVNWFWLSLVWSEFSLTRDCVTAFTKVPHSIHLQYGEQQCVASN